VELLVVIDAAMTETAQLGDYVLPPPCGYEKWEQAGFPKAYPEVYLQLRPPLVPGPPEAVPEPEIYARLAEAMGLVDSPPSKLFELAQRAGKPEGAAAYFAELQSVSGEDGARLLFWGYRTLGPELPAPSLVSVWALCIQNAFLRRDGVLRTLGAAWTDRGSFEIALELFHRILAHPEGVEIARADLENPLASHVGWEDGRIRLSPPRMIEEIARAVATEPKTDPDYPLILANGLRTGWTANTIQRDPAWRKGRGPHCPLHMAPADAERLSIEDGEEVRLVTRRGSALIPVALDAKLQSGHVWIPNGFGIAYPSGAQGELEVQGVNGNDLSDAADRDPISGCPHHKITPCRVERLAAN
jgi:anaerobic selenocysteine-containing dehydrogenase